MFDQTFTNFPYSPMNGYLSGDCNSNFEIRIRIGLCFVSGVDTCCVVFKVKIPFFNYLWFSRPDRLSLS